MGSVSLTFAQCHPGVPARPRVLYLHEQAWRTLWEGGSIHPPGLGEPALQGWVHRGPTPQPDTPLPPSFLGPCQLTHSPSDAPARTRAAGPSCLGLRPAPRLSRCGNSAKFINNSMPLL